MTLGKTIRAARNAQDLTLDDVCAVLEISPVHLSGIELDRRIPSEDTLRRIARVLSLDADELRAMAGKLTEDEWDYLKRTPTVLKLLIVMKEAGFGEKEVEKLVRQVEKKSK